VVIISTAVLALGSRSIRGVLIKSAAHPLIHLQLFNLSVSQQ